MHWFRERLLERDEREDRLRAHEVYDDFYVRGLDRIERWEEQDTRRIAANGRTSRSTANAERRSIERLFKLEANAWQEAYATEEEIRECVERTGFTPAELRALRWMDQMGETKVETPEVDPRHQRQSTGRRDVQDNFLYQQWLSQLGRVSSIRTYPVFALFTSIKAAVSLLTSKTGGYELLGHIHNSELSPYPSRDDLIAIKILADYDDHDPSWLISQALTVPGLLQVAESLMMYYSDFVRAERKGLDNDDESVVSSALPDDPGNFVMSDNFEPSEALRIEQALLAVQANEGTTDEIASRYGLPQKRFRAIVRERGLNRPRGGDQIGKKG